MTPRLPANPDSPLVREVQVAILRLASAHAAAEVDFARALSGGFIGATRIGSVLIVDASGAVADELEKLLEDSGLARPQEL